MPTEEPEVTEEPVITEEITPEVTEEPTPEITKEEKYPEESIEYEIPELLTMGAAPKSYVEWGESGKLYDVAVNLLVLGDEEKEKYPELAQTFENMNSECLDFAESKADQYDEFIKSGYELDGNRYYFVDDYYDIIRADSYVVSLTSTDSSFEGGVHPDYGTVGIMIS